MTRIVTTVDIARPIAAVFDYVTTPANWPAWHPASRALVGGDHPLALGEEVTEEFVAAGRRGAAREVPRLWTIAATAESGRATITYRLRETAEGTRFERELVYHLSKPGLRLLDLLVLRWRMARESREALRRLEAESR